MKALREKRTKKEISQQRKPYDQKYNIKRRLNKEQAAALIQRQFRKNKQEQESKKEASKIAADILNDIIDVVPKEAAKKKNRDAVARHRARFRTAANARFRTAANGRENARFRPHTKTPDFERLRIGIYKI